MSFCSFGFYRPPTATMRSSVSILAHFVCKGMKHFPNDKENCQKFRVFFKKRTKCLVYDHSPSLLLRFR